MLSLACKFSFSHTFLMQEFVNIQNVIVKVIFFCCPAVGRANIQWDCEFGNRGGVCGIIRYP